jgi:hypothetical protein
VKSHLSPSEIVDFAEGTLASARASHVETCPACAQTANELRAALHGALSAKDDVPEPSPLFWDHLSSRVQEAITSGAPAPPSWWSWWSWWLPRVRILAPLATFALVVVVLTMTLPRGAARPHESAKPGAPSAVSEVDRPVDPSLDPVTGEAWDVLAAAAADLEWEAAHEAGMGVHPAAIDGAVQQLAPEELSELAKLLQTELKRSSD